MSDADTTTADLPPETPGWVDDARAVRAEDLRDPSEVPRRSPRSISDRARACFQAPHFPHASAFYQLLDHHDLAYVGEIETSPTGEHAENDTKRTWRSEELKIVAHGPTTYPEEDSHPYISYLKLDGPATAVVAFVEDLLDVCERIKRELPAPALLEHADAAFEAGEPVPDEHRLVDRGRAATVVDHVAPPENDGDEAATDDGDDEPPADDAETAPTPRQAVPETCAVCGNTPVSPRHAHRVFPNLDERKSGLVEQALEADLWFCAHCPAIIGGDERPVGGGDG